MIPIGYICLNIIGGVMAWIIIVDNEKIHEIIRSAVDCEVNYVNEALKCDIIGMNSSKMIEYVKYVADHLLVMMGHTKLYYTENPFEWMDLISLEGKTNFFEKRVGDYQKANVMNYDASSTS